MEIILLAGFILTLVMLVLLAIVLAQLVLQNGRILLRIEELEAQPGGWEDADLDLEPYVPNLSTGVAAPVLELLDLNGTLRSLSEWRGRRLLIVFFDPNCAFSRELLPSLVSLADDVVAGRPMPLVVSTGSVEENRRLFDEAGYPSPVLLQRGMEVAASYRIDGTPVSYLISEDGRVLAGPAFGVQATLLMAGEIAAYRDETASYDINGSGTEVDSSLNATAWPRDGLRVGESAPVFRLPLASGDGALSLLDCRGKASVLVFWDPECEPCDVLAAELEEIHRREPSLSLVMISRGDPALTRAAIARHGLSFPVAMQRHWEVSREYGIFATPVAFAIDEWGTIGADVATGREDILALVHAVLVS